MDGLRGLVYEPVPPPPPQPPTPPGPSLPFQDVEDTAIHFEVKSSLDGVLIAGDVFVPIIPNMTTFPTVLVMSPYFEGAKNASDGNRPEGGSYEEWYRLFMPRGYAYALVEVRGTATSDGCIDLAGPREQQDAYDAVEWLGTQAWSNGKVGMLGASYDGLTQIEATALNPPHLAAIVPIAPVTDWYHVQGKGGAKYTGWTPGTPYGYNFAIGGAQDKLTGGDASQRCAFENLALASDPSGDYNSWMKERDLRPLASGAKAPMFYVHGFLDVNARPDHIDPWYTEYGGPKRAFLWQMPHTAPTTANTGIPDDWWLIQVVMWFDYHLMGLENQQNATYGTAMVQDNVGRWRIDHDNWPPTNLTQTPFYLGAGKIESKPVAGGKLLWRDNPSEDGYHFGHKSSKIVQGSGDFRLPFQSEPLAAELHYAGRPMVRASVESSNTNTLVVIRLYDILPDDSWVMVNRGVHSLRHRDGLDNPQPGAPLVQTYVVEAEMQPNDYVFRAGHRIGLTISSSDASYILPSGSMAANQLVTGGEGGSALLLPVIDVPAQSIVFTSWGGQQPGWSGPFAGGGK